MILRTTILTAALACSGSVALAQTRFPAVLEGHAILPALTFVTPPADAPPELQISGRYATPSPKRVDEVAAEHENNMDDRDGETKHEWRLHRGRCFEDDRDKDTRMVTKNDNDG